MVVQAAGPMWPGGFETIVQSASGQRYEVLYLPDLRNDELQAAGKAPVYYWLPNAIRIAGEPGARKFRLTHFEGVRSEETTVGVTGTNEVAGGVLAVTVTAAPPLDVLQASHNQLTERLRADPRKYWGYRVPVPPQFAPVPISDSRTSMSNLSPRLDGTVPSDQTPPAPAGGGAPGGPGAPGAPRSAPVATRRPRLVRSPRTVPEGRDVTPSGLDAWYMRIEGQGPGSLNPAGENAYVALCGALPTAILWAGFHGTYSPVVVSQALTLKVWSETLTITINGNWDRIFSHFSAAAQGRAWWFNADIKAEFNNLRISGGIDVTVAIDGTVPGADKMKEEVDKRIDLIVNKFTEEAKARIFDPAPPEVKPAEAQGGGVASLFSPYSAGFALKYRRDETKLDLHYNETRLERFNLPTTISSSLEGFYEEIKAEPGAEQRYFTTLFLEDWDRKITHNVKPVVNWPDPARKWVGDPVAFLAVQVGYPSAAGDIQWTPHVFQSTDTGQATTWQPAFAKKGVDDVTNAPAGWTPDISYIRRTVHFTEPPSETDNPFVRCFVEKNEVVLDPGANGVATNELNIEVRADSAGKLDIGPIQLGAILDGPTQIVEVEFQAEGKTDDGTARPVVRFQFNAADQDKERYWTIFTGQPDFLPRYSYRVHVIVKGSIFTQGMEWWGAWRPTSGNGPLMVVVPTADEAVERRRLVPGARTEPGGLPVVGGANGGAPATGGNGQGTGVPAEQPGGVAGKPGSPAGKPRSTVPAAPVGKQADPPGNGKTVQGYALTGGTEKAAPETAETAETAEKAEKAGTRGERGPGEDAPTPVALPTFVVPSTAGWTASPVGTGA
jgi:hypothetical protein